MENEFFVKAEEFERNNKAKIQRAWKKLEDFLNLFPFHVHPEKIDEMTPERIYTPGDKKAFFYWPEFGLKEFGNVGGFSAFYAESARDNAEIFKELLKRVVDDTVALSEKIEPWDELKWFGGDRTIAKKIIFCYYSKEVLPIFSTSDLEHFASKLKLNFEKEAYEYGKSYSVLSVGQKFELINSLLLKYKESVPLFKKWDNLLFTKFLYEYFPPPRKLFTIKEIKPLHSLGILFEPEYEQEVVYLFSLFHRDLGFPYIIKIRNEFPDAIVMDRKKNVRKIEFEVRASQFNHDPKGCDFIVCWENDLENYEHLPPIIALKDFVEGLK